MSPASKSKAKDKKASKELQKPTLKPTAPAAAGSSSSVPASAYNPLLGTFHALESTVSLSSPLNGRFKNIDDTDAQSGVLLSSTAEYDTVSNNGSWSGESEDHKEKKSNPAVRHEPIPGADIDKREKIRQKNEKKHQRQKERRAQELNERCSGYLMSRKLEALAQQLVAMGFSKDRATVALMLNEGKIEESVAWLFEGGEEANDDSVNQSLGGQNLKLDISEELARIVHLESQFKCTKQEVERAVVASEGDLDKAAESLRELKLDPPAAPTRPEETSDTQTFVSSKFPGNTSQALRPQAKPNPPFIQQRKEEKDFNYTKGAITATPLESIGKNSSPLPLRRSQPKMEWGNYEQITTAEKRWPSSGTSPISFSLASAPPTQLSSPPMKHETNYLALGSEFNNLQSGPVREPSSIVQLQNPSLRTKQALVGSVSSSPPSSWYSSNGLGTMKSTSEFLPQIRSVRSFNPSDVTLNQMYPHAQYQQQQLQQQHQQQQLQHQQQQQLLQQQQQQHQQQQQQRFVVPGNSRGDFLEGNHTTNTSWSRTGASSSIAAASSLGLFSGTTSTQSGASSSVDWNTGSSMQHLDYSNIDWSVDKGLTSVQPGGGLNSSPYTMQKNGHLYESNTSRYVDAQPFVPSNLNRGGGVPMGGLQNGGGGGGVAPPETSANNGSSNDSREWSSPFEGKDIFSFPRKFAFPPP